MNSHVTLPKSLDEILDEQYRRHTERVNRSTDREIDTACRSAVERIGERKQIKREARG